MTLRPAWDTGGISKGVGGKSDCSRSFYTSSSIVVFHSIPFHSTIMNIVTEYDSVNGPYNPRS